VKLPFDENLSRRLPARISDIFAGSAHVIQFNLLESPDWSIWKFAQDNGFAIITADADFYTMAIKRGAPPKVIWLRGCDYATAVAAELIRSQAIRIADFLQDPDRSVLVLPRK
jgi:predicted nuclease of predicted toxin-antitoxin system